MAAARSRRRRSTGTRTAPRRELRGGDRRRRSASPPARVFPANGSNEVLQTLLLTYGGPGRRALVFEPTYALHSHIARITGTEVVAGAAARRLPRRPRHARGR